MLCIQIALGLNLSLETTILTDIVCDFSQFLQADFGILSHIHLT